MPKIQKQYLCEICDFKCSKQSNLSTHFATNKHKSKLEKNDLNQENASLNEFVCKYCTKKYKARNSLWYHEQKCIINKNDSISLTENINDKLIDASNNEIKVLTSLVLEIVKSNTDLQKQCIEFQKQNQDLQKQVLDVCQKIQPASITNNNTTTNSNNKTFNLQFFLNEQCKDAMNLKDFVNSFQLNLEDLERVGQHGYVDGIAHIIIKKLKDTDMHKRPFHCSDAKRETLYVKDDNVWEKEGIENLKMVKAVKDVGQKNFNVLNDYRALHPDCLQSDSEYNDKYIKLMIQAVGSQKENVNKVIKKIAKEVVIEKE